MNGYERFSIVWSIFDDGGRHIARSAAKHSRATARRRIAAARNDDSHYRVILDRPKA
jgi:hypothetical protein